MKTYEEIEQLKKSWRADPSWDIEDTEGFEDYRDELLAYRIMVEVEVEKKVKAGLNQRLETIAKELGIVGNPVSALYLHTFAEIEAGMNQIPDSQLGELPIVQLAQLEFMRAQTRATLLLAAQVMRLANSVESFVVQEESSNTTGFMTSLFNIDRK